MFARIRRRLLIDLVSLAAAALLTGCQSAPPQPVEATRPSTAKTVVSAPHSARAALPALPPFFSDLHARTFHFFWDVADPVSGLVPDRFPAPSHSSIAAVGFALSAYTVGAERGYITRTQAAERTQKILRVLYNAPQGSAPSGVSGHKGFFYHFLDMRTGLRAWNSELSTVDTALFMAGALSAQEYFSGDNANEAEIRLLVKALYERIDWGWAQTQAGTVSMGWSPESGWIASKWEGYNEAMIVYVLGLASPTHPLSPDAWSHWTRTYERSWGNTDGQELLRFGPLFGHQYSHIWIDFRGIRDLWSRSKGLDYFENSRRAALAQRQYANRNPLGWEGYGGDIWGVTASDGPADVTQPYRGEQRRFISYAGRGVGGLHDIDDGTLAPTGALGMIAFAPDIVIPAAIAMHERYGKHLYSEFGFLDAFNPSYQYATPKLTHGKVVPGVGWIAGDYLGIDQGPILLMLENHSHDFIWKLMRRNQIIRSGLTRAGFSGGWLDNAQ